MRFKNRFLLLPTGRLVCRNPKIKNNKDGFDSHSESPAQGSGQGLSWAGPRWINTGSNISGVMEKTNTGMQFIDPTGELIVKKRGDFYLITTT